VKTASEMTYTVSGGALNSAQLNPELKGQNRLKVVLDISLCQNYVSSDSVIAKYLVFLCVVAIHLITLHHTVF